MINYTLKNLAAIIQGELIGNGDLTISSLATLDDCSEKDLTFLLDVKHFNKACNSNAAAYITCKKIPEKNQIVVKNARVAMAKTLTLFCSKQDSKPEISSKADISSSARIAKNTTIGAFSVIGKNVVIEEKVIIGPQVSIGDNCIIKKGSILNAGVVLYPNVFIGQNTIIHAGAVIGVDGFGYVPTNETWQKIPHIGKVIIEDNVEIGANTCIDRGCIGNTIIKSGSKIDNLVHIAHNNEIGNNCAITGHVALAGSVKLGNHVMIGGQAGIKDNTTIGDNCIIMARAGVTKNFPENSILSGFPAKNHKEELKIQAKLMRILNKY